MMSFTEKLLQAMDPVDFGRSSQALRFYDIVLNFCKNFERHPNERTRLRNQNPEYLSQMALCKF